MSNSPHPGGPKGLVGRDEPNRRDGPSQGSRGEDRQGGSAAGPGTFADSAIPAEHLTRGTSPKPRKRYGYAG